LSSTCKTLRRGFGTVVTRWLEAQANATRRQIHRYYEKNLEIFKNSLHFKELYGKISALKELNVIEGFYSLNHERKAAWH